MTPSEFVSSIYLGDRACKSIVVDGWARELKVQVDLISRVRGEVWNYYQAENLPNGFIVFEGVSRIEWDPSGKIPNDAIIALTVEPCSTQESKYIFRLEVSSGDDRTGTLSPVQIHIFADNIAIEAAQGGPRIRD